MHQWKGFVAASSLYFLLQATDLDGELTVTIGEGRNLRTASSWFSNLVPVDPSKPTAAGASGSGPATASGGAATGGLPTISEHGPAPAGGVKGASPAPHSAGGASAEAEADPQASNVPKVKSLFSSYDPVEAHQHHLAALADQYTQYKAFVAQLNLPPPQLAPVTPSSPDGRASAPGTAIKVKGPKYETNESVGNLFDDISLPEGAMTPPLGVRVSHNIDAGLNDGKTFKSAMSKTAQENMNKVGALWLFAVRNMNTFHLPTIFYPNIF